MKRLLPIICQLPNRSELQSNPNATIISQDVVNNVLPVNTIANEHITPTVTIINMSDPMVAKASGELSGLIFQVEEILDDLQDISGMNLGVLQGYHDDLKALRINIVKVSSELKVLMSVRIGGAGDGSPAAVVTDADVSELLRASGAAGLDITALMNASKKLLLMLRQAIDSQQNSIDTNHLVAQQQKDLEHAAVKQERKFAFDKTMEEVISLIGSLTIKYDVRSDARTLTPEIVTS